MGESFSKLREAKKTEVSERENESNQSSKSQSLASGEFNVEYIKKSKVSLKVISNITTQLLLMNNWKGQKWLGAYFMKTVLRNCSESL